MKGKRGKCHPKEIEKFGSLHTPGPATAWMASGSPETAVRRQLKMEMENGSASSYARMLCSLRGQSGWRSIKIGIVRPPFVQRASGTVQGWVRLSSGHHENPRYGVIRQPRSTRCKKGRVLEEA